MRFFRNWSIRRKLILPLFLVEILGGAGILYVFVGIYDEITEDSLPEERALEGIRSTSLELLSEYREFMLVPSEETQGEVDELKQEIGAQQGVFGTLAPLESSEAPFVEAIDLAVRTLVRQGDATVALRGRLLDQFVAMEELEIALEMASDDQAAGDAGAAQVDLSPGLDELAQEYLSELREYVLMPNESTHREIEEIEGLLEEVLKVREQDAEPRGVYPPLARRMLETGRRTIDLAHEFLAELEVLEAAEDDLLAVLEEATSVVASKTDKVFNNGFNTAILIILAVLAMIFLVGYWVSRGFGTQLSALSKAADQLGRGDLSARVELESGDEIGGLTDAFNRMATSLESNVEGRKRAEQELQKTDALIRALIANSPSETFVQDEGGHYILVNRAWMTKMSLSEDDVLGRTNQDIFQDDRAAIFMRQDRMVRETGEVLDEELEIPFGDRVRTIHTVKFPLLDDQRQIVGVGGIMNDVTDFRRAEKELRQAQKMEAVGQLTGGVAHDFNNLLAVVQGNAELLSEEVGRTSPLVQAITRASRRGAELTQRLLAFSRQQTLQPKPTDLPALVASMTDLLQRTLRETIEIETVAREGLALVMADPGQIENALLNLAINARDAMPDGGKLTIECDNAYLDEDYVARNPEAIAGDYVVLAVSDTGSGMSAEVKAHAFEPFFTTKEVGQGSGLGLSMVYGFAKQSGGHVTIYSEEGQGTTVKLYLLPSDVNPQAKEDVPKASTPGGRGETILVIEDDDDVRSMASQTLTRMAYRVYEAADAASARDILNSAERIDLVLSDVVLPGGMSGPEFAGELRQSHASLPIIFMSGYPTEAARRNGFLGSDRVLLNKPFQMERLAKALRDALD